MIQKNIKKLTTKELDFKIGYAKYLYSRFKQESILRDLNKLKKEKVNRSSKYSKLVKT